MTAGMAPPYSKPHPQLARPGESLSSHAPVAGGEVADDRVCDPWQTDASLPGGGGCRAARGRTHHAPKLILMHPEVATAGSQQWLSFRWGGLSWPVNHVHNVDNL